jgi:hypothetical protein
MASHAPRLDIRVRYCRIHRQSTRSISCWVTLRISTRARPARVPLDEQFVGGLDDPQMLARAGDAQQALDLLRSAGHGELPPVLL